MADRNANDDVRQRRALQRQNATTESLAAQVAALTALVNGLVLEAGSVPIGNETPAGTIDGTNLEFELANEPLPDSLQLFRNGLLLRPGSGNDYTTTGTTIAFVAGNAPATGDSLVAFYRASA